MKGQISSPSACIRSRSNRMCVCVKEFERVGFAQVKCIDWYLGWKSDPPLLRARPVIMSDILDGLRSYPLFMYSQVKNLGQPFFFLFFFPLPLTVLAPEDFEWKISRNLGCFVSAVFSCFLFPEYKKKKNSIQPPCHPSGPGVLLSHEYVRVMSSK